MLKIEVNKVKKEKKPKTPKYPYYGKYPDGAIVLFTDSDTGMCVEAGPENKLFEISTIWEESEATPIDNYSITISTIN